MKNEPEFTDEQLDYIALCIIQAVHCYSYLDHYTASKELLSDSWYAQSCGLVKAPYWEIMRRIERVGKANGYWEV